MAYHKQIECKNLAKVRIIPRFYIGGYFTRICFGTINNGLIGIFGGIVRRDVGGGFLLRGNENVKGAAAAKL